MRARFVFKIMFLLQIVWLGCWFAIFSGLRLLIDSAGFARAQLLQGEFDQYGYRTRSENYAPDGVESIAHFGQ
jgi:hypothetical protein